MDIMKLLIDFHIDAERQGPGSNKTTLEALYALPNYQTFEKILDIGCGTGAGTIVLAKNIPNAKVTALDLLPEFLAKLNEKAKKDELNMRIKTVEGSMDALPFSNGEFDLIWAEGCIYHVGFEFGLREWKRFIKPNGYLVVSELCWITDNRPAEIAKYWINGYPEIGTIAEKIDIAKKCGYELIHYFSQSDECWINNYYQPIRSRSKEFAEKYGNTPDVMTFIEEGLQEADIYDKYKDYYSYVFFVMQNKL